MKRSILVVSIVSSIFGALLLTTYHSKINNKTAAPMSTATEQETNNETTNTKTMLLAGGCFWCVEADLEKLPNVLSAVSGYAGGSTDNPTYENYRQGGHKEVVQITYNPTLISFREIAIFALKHMDPTDGEGSFYDRGVAYGPALYYEDDAEKEILSSLVKTIDQNGPYEKPLAVAILPRPIFWPAEDYHQDYYKGTLSGLKYQYYRTGSGRDTFIEKHWGNDTAPALSWEKDPAEAAATSTSPWQNYQKPDAATLQASLDTLAYRVTQEEGTERAGTSPYDKEYGRGIYVDILSGEPLFSSREKFDSGTGWPSFTAPISEDRVTLHEDKKLFSTRTEVRSATADNHLGHVFPDGPTERGGQRYCMNGVALRFIPEAEMTTAGYVEYLKDL